MTKFIIPIILGCLVILYSCSTDQSASEKQQIEYEIAYNVLVDEKKDNYDVFCMSMNGDNGRNITNLEGVEWTYISDGEEIFFISDRDTCHRCMFLYSMKSDGSDIRKIGDIQLADSWMSTRKNGDEIIVRPHSSIDSVFYIINKKGEIIKKLDPQMPYCGDPLFVNNAQQVVFRGGKTKSKLIEGFNEELYIIDVDGSNKRQLTHYPVSDTSAGKFGYRAGTPKLHPSGKFITYQSKQNGKYSLYAVNVDGSKQWKLTDVKENEGWHDWSPDGKWLAIELFDNDQTQFHIGLMNWETKDLKILTKDNYQYQQCPNFVIKGNTLNSH